MTKSQKTKRTQINDLVAAQAELTEQQMTQVKGATRQTDLGGGITGAQASVIGTTPLPTTTTTGSSNTAKPSHDAVMNPPRNMK